jgi:hypothetical protein
MLVTVNVFGVGREAHAVIAPARAATECDGIEARERQDKKCHNAQIIGGGWRDQTA